MSPEDPELTPRDKRIGKRWIEYLTKQWPCSVDHLVKVLTVYKTGAQDADLVGPPEMPTLTPVIWRLRMLLEPFTSLDLAYSEASGLDAILDAFSIVYAEELDAEEWEYSLGYYYETIRPDCVTNYANPETNPTDWKVDAGWLNACVSLSRLDARGLCRWPHLAHLTGLPFGIRLDDDVVDFDKWEEGDPWSHLAGLCVQLLGSSRQVRERWAPSQQWADEEVNSFDDIPELIIALPKPPNDDKLQKLVEITAQHLKGGGHDLRSDAIARTVVDVFGPMPLFEKILSAPE